MIGRVLDGRYRVVAELGGGGFSRTYIGEDTRRPGNPKCVIKHLFLDRFDPQQVVIAKRLFKGEAETLEKLGRHDQIPQLFAYLEEEFCLVQEFIEGVPLNVELVPEQHWSEAKVVELLNDVLGILEYVHQQGVIHRDIKPENLIRRQSDGKFVLIDFGAVKLIPQSLGTQAQINPTIMIGTLGYYPTEQGQGRPRPSSDLYALGMIAIQALTGIHPRAIEEEPTTGEIQWQHLIPVTPKLADVLTKLVRYHFKDRYLTATDAIAAVRSLQTQPQGRPRSTIVWGSAIAAGGVAIAALIFLKFSQPTPQTTPANGAVQSSSTPSRPIPTNPQTPSALPSQVRYNYEKLQIELRRQNLEEANQTTFNLMLGIAGQKSSNSGAFDPTEWNRFPCDQLVKIDQLWSSASNGEQGFSVQSDVYQKFGKNIRQFYRAVGWADERGTIKKKIDFNNLRKGSLPVSSAFQGYAACKL